VGVMTSTEREVVPVKALGLLARGGELKRFPGEHLAECRV